MKGRITKIFDDRKFFFVDNEYWCHYERIDFAPSVFAEVEYERSTDRNDKKVAMNVKLVNPGSGATNNSSVQNSFFNDYLAKLNDGYFASAD